MTIPDSGFFMNNETSCLPCTPEEEKRIVKELTDSAGKMKLGDSYYVVSNRWFMDWRRYVGEDTGEHSNGVAQRPGPIDNSHLVVDWNGTDRDDLEMHRTMLEERDYVLVCQEVWKKLHDWYKGGPALPRKVIPVGITHLSVEVYPLCLQLTDSRDDRQLVIRISKKASVRELYDRVCTLLELDLGKVKIWDYFNKEKMSILEVSDKTLEDVCLHMDQDILLEVQPDGFQSSRFGMDSTGNELALVPIEPSRSSVTIAGGPTLSNGDSAGYGPYPLQGNRLSSALLDADDGYDLKATMTKGEGGGLAGLQNLGNTCFMNSALQCLVHTPPLVEYFLQDYTEEINKQNPLGMHGELAIAFGDLLRKLWSSGRAPIAPRQFKGKLARFAPQFSGYNQHDSQELLAFLLDGLHEDLNRVKNKPYIEAKDANGRPDEEVADECWENHKARNDSVIVDVCQGQYKSTLVCPACGKISVTFDPFMYLSLPLPSFVQRTMTITVFYGDGSALPMPFTVTVLKHGLVKDLSQALSNACCLKSDESLFLAEVYEHRIYRYLDNSFESLTTIKDEDHVVAYRIPKECEGFTRLEITQRCKEKCVKDKPSNRDSKFLGTPLITYLAECPQTGADIQSAVHRMLVPLRRSCLPLAEIQTSHRNGSTSGVPINDRSSEHMSSPSMDGVELEHISNGESSFQLSLTDEKLMSSISIENASNIRKAQCIRILLNWSDRESELYDISYLEDLPEVYKTGITAKKTRQEAITLFSCLEAFLKEEPLGPDDMWYCPTCKEHKQATKKLDLWKLPEILVVHLKRFSYSRYLKNKLDTFVNFPIRNLDLSKYLRSRDPTQCHLYELYAVSNHYGGLGGGHYSAYAKLIEGDNRWYHFDDSHVSPVAENEIKTSAAYVLFYRRVKVAQDNAVGEPSQDPSSTW